MPEPLLAVDRLVKRFGALSVSNGLSLAVEPGELHAIIGPNGAGKTTLVAQLAGEILPDSGTIRFAGEDITRLAASHRARRGLMRSFQITCLCNEYSAVDNVALVIQARRGHSFRFWRRASADTAILAPARECLDRVGLAARADVPAGLLSHGEQRQLELAMALAASPRLLLLDEPLAGMGREESLRMTQLLKTLKGAATILLVEHDLQAIFELADRISVLVDGACLMTGSPGEIRRDPHVRNAYLGDEDIDEDPLPERHMA